VTRDPDLDDQGARLWHPWLRINRVIRSMTRLHRDRAIRPILKAGFNEALAIRETTKRAGWFNETITTPGVKAPEKEVRAHHAQSKAGERVSDW
jgi:hypothetical protein